MDPYTAMAARFYRTALLLIALAATAVTAALVGFLGLGWPLALGAALALALGIHAGILGIEFILAAILNHRHPLPEGYPVSGRGNGLLAWLVEVPSAWRTFGLAIPWQSGRALASGQDPDKVPLLFVHGFTCNQAIWHPMARHFASRGHVIGGVNLEPLKVSIDEYSSLIDTAVRELIARSGTSQVALVGHSMGGIAIRAYCRDFGYDAVRQVITLGSPHFGTWITRLTRATNAQQLALYSDWLASLSQSEDDKAGSLYSTITSLHDNIIFPAAIQPLPASRAAFLRGIGHVDMLYRQSVWQCIADEIEVKDQQALERQSNTESNA